MAAIAAALATAACTAHEDHASQDTVQAYIATLTPASVDPRSGDLVGFIRVADEMLRGNDAVEDHVDAVTLRLACMQATYGIRGEDRRTDAVQHLTETPKRAARWRRYVAVSSRRPSVLPTEEACNF